MAWPFLSRAAIAAPERSEPVLRPTSIPKVLRRDGPIIARSRRSYDAGETDRLTFSWTSVPLTADQVVDRNQRILVARSRDQAAKNDYLKSFLRLCSQNIVGSKGFILQAQAKDESGALDRRANDVIKA